MNSIIKTVSEAKHIVVIAHSDRVDSFASASAMYTYLLMLHKKVSFFCITKSVNAQLKFIPWSDKVRNSYPSSVDVAISFDYSNVELDKLNIECKHISIEYSLLSKSCISITQSLFDLFKNNQIKINKKMATALYAGLLHKSNAFLDSRVDGTIFAMAEQLVDGGADKNLCNKFIMKYQLLGVFRLKALLQTKMQLVESAKVAMFIVTQEELLSCGVDMQSAEVALRESLFLPTVKVAYLLKRSENSKVEGYFIFDEKGYVEKYNFSFIDENSNKKNSKKVLELINKEIEIE